MAGFVTAAALFSLVSISGSSDVFRSVGGSVQLDTQRSIPKFDELIWEFNSTKSVVKYYKGFNQTKQFPGYEGRVEFNERTYTLTLKNLQKTDSGLYEAKVSGDQNLVVAVYTLSVLDPVKTPVLTHQVNRDTCNITLTCRSQDLSISSSCYNGTCEEKNETSPGGVTLSLSVRGSSIICNHSNPVSWKNKTLEMGELKRSCTDGGGGKHRAQGGDAHWRYTGPIIGLICPLLVAAAAAVLVYKYWRRSRGVSEEQLYSSVPGVSGNTQPEETVYTAVEGPRQETVEMSTVYSVVQKVPQPTSNGESGQTSPDPENEKQLISVETSGSNTYDTVPNQSQSVKPETVYATVTKPSKPVNPDSVDGTSLP